MNRATAIHAIKDACKHIAVEMMRIQPAIPALEDAPTQKRLFETIYELTKNVETIKKQVGRLEKEDPSTLL